MLSEEHEASIKMTKLNEDLKSICSGHLGPEVFLMICHISDMNCTSMFDYKFPKTCTDAEKNKKNQSRSRNGHKRMSTILKVNNPSHR